MIHLALWDTLPGDLLESGFSQELDSDSINIIRDGSKGCEELLQTSQVDIAMIPAVSVLKNTSLYDVYPVLALSSWAFPFVQLILKEGLRRPVSQVAYQHGYDQEKFVAQLILTEHYQQQVSFSGYDTLTGKQIETLGEDACLLVGRDVPDHSYAGLALDLGQEWYELANYPFVWSLFVSRRDTAQPQWLTLLNRVAERLDDSKSEWIRAQKMSPKTRSFFENELRTRLDDLAVASLTELQQYLFYFDLIEEIGDINYVYLNE